MDHIRVTPGFQACPVVLNWPTAPDSIGYRRDTGQRTEVLVACDVITVVRMAAAEAEPVHHSPVPTNSDIHIHTHCWFLMLPMPAAVLGADLFVTTRHHKYQHPW